MTRRKWSELKREQKLELIKFCDSLFIPPNFVKDMYESGEIDYFKTIKN